MTEEAPAGRLVVGVDIGRFHAQVCILDADIGSIAEHQIISTATAFAELLQPLRAAIRHLVMEATDSSFHLCRRLQAMGFPVLLVDPRNAAPFLRAYRQAKTDKNDAFGLAQLVAHGAQRNVWLRSAEASELSAMLATRDALIRSEVALRNAIGSHLAAIGLVVKSRSRAKCLRLFREALDRTDSYAFLRQIYLPLEQLDAHITALSDALKAKAAEGSTSKLLMTIPGVGPFTALRFIALIDFPGRFKSSRSVGAYVGLTARVHQSGSVRRMGGLTRFGSTELRRSLFMGAQVVLTKSKKSDRLRDWALRIARRRGKKRAIVALARKLAVVMHAVWTSGRPYEG